nr:zf-CCHC domain-containing protein/DUF4219 domain-containing protein/UBN2 domain-containing protein [Tanacetum cinerariifolium]
MDDKKGKSDRKCFRCGDQNHLIGDCPKPSCNKDQKAFIGGSWSDSENDAKDKTNDETCLMAQSSNEDFRMIFILSSIETRLQKTAKDLWDALARHMLGFEYGEQDRKAAVLYEYETFKATEGELLLDTYIRYLQVINDLKKCGYSKDNYDKKVKKKANEKKHDMSRVKCYNYKKEGHFAKDCKKAK